ncbi:hypothetical protein GKZ28_26895 [Clostridium chromiireducens]|uniref:BIG2 domain-containing protein n=1 Tax=Clostridium chromiireducens TaxID=225345 RepID=A0A964RSY3_9CLOT|nr:RHS repeat-associated core domain-containing protein [Clostridium chromiireducens]MVX67271.1 hypothetical protein [Clostridium chromiireducens]
MNVKNLKRKSTLLVLLLAIIFCGILGINTEVKADTATQTSEATSAATTVAVTGVILSKTTDTLTLGKVDTLVATILPANATNKNVTWSTSSEDTVKVDQNGVVTAVGLGTAMITVKTEDGGIMQWCTVTVGRDVIEAKLGESYIFTNNDMYNENVISGSFNGSTTGKINIAIYNKDGTESNAYMSSSPGQSVPAGGKAVLTVVSIDNNSSILELVYSNFTCTRSSSPAITTGSMKVGGTYVFTNNDSSGHTIYTKDFYAEGDINLAFYNADGTENSISSVYSFLNYIYIEAGGKVVITIESISGNDSNIEFGTCGNYISFQTDIKPALIKANIKEGESYVFTNNDINDHYLSYPRGSLDGLVDVAVYDKDGAEYFSKLLYRLSRLYAYDKMGKVMGNIEVPAGGKAVVTVDSVDNPDYAISLIGCNNNFTCRASGVPAMMRATLKRPDGNYSYVFTNNSEKYGTIIAIGNTNGSGGTNKVNATAYNKDGTVAYSDNSDLSMTYYNYYNPGDVWGGYGVPGGGKLVITTISSMENAWQRTIELGGCYNCFTVAVGSGLDSSKDIEKIDPQQSNSAKIADPVDASTGAHVIDGNVLKLKGARSLEFNMEYNSLLLNTGTMGIGWDHNFDSKLTFQGDGSINVEWSANRINSFTSSNGINYSTSDLSYRSDLLLKNSDNSYTLTRNDGTVYNFDSTGRLTSEKNRNGQALNMAYDDSGKLIKVVELISGVSLNILYNENGLIDNVSDGLNRKILFRYDSNNNLISCDDGNGNVINYSYNESGQVTKAVDNKGRKIFENTYDDKGRVITQDDGIDGNKLTTFSYDNTSEYGYIITKVTDRNGNASVFKHDKNYNLIEEKDNEGYVKSYTYDEHGNRLSYTDENGNITKYTYDNIGNLTSITDALGNVTKMTYDEKNNLISEENSEGKKATYSYDENNNLVTKTDMQGNTMKKVYDSNGELISYTDRDGATTKFTYYKGMLAEKSDSLGNKTHYEYDAAGRIIKSTNALGKATTFEYDSEDNIISVTDPLGNKVTSTYDILGNKLTETDANGNVTKYEYDENGNLITVIDPLGSKITYEYDGEGRPIKATDKNGNSTTYTYDSEGRKTSITDALGNTIKMNYDDAGNLIGTVDALGNTISIREYDPLNRVVSTTDAISNTKTIKYNSLGRVQRVTDAMGHNTSLTYDDLGRLISSTDSLGGTSNQTFDAEGSKTSVVDANGNKVIYSYDSEGRIISETSEEGKTIKYEYNPKGQISKMINGRGQEITYSYDDSGRMTGYADDLGGVKCIYDANGNVLSIKDSKGTISKEYDALNRVTKYTDANGNTIKYGYDDNGNIVSITYPNGKKVQYAYNGLNKLSTVTDWNNNVTSYDYDADGRLAKETKPDGSICTYEYDKSSQILEITDVDKSGSIINKYNYSYESNGNVKSEESYIKNSVIPADSKNMTYGKDNQIATYNGQNITFDADGNMTNGPLNGNMVNYNYDCRNRLVSVGNTQYEYDALNNRIAVIENGNRTNYVVNPNSQLSQVLMKKDADGKETYYVYGLGLISQEDEKDGYKVYHYDRRGSTTAIASNDGKVTDRLQYDAYGKLISHEGSTDISYQYVGRYGIVADKNGLSYMRARYYNPDIKRFVNKDIIKGSIDDSQSLNRFAYVQNNPINRIDPSGNLYVVDDVVKFGIGFVDGVATQYILDVGHNANKVKSWRDIPSMFVPKSSLKNYIAKGVGNGVNAVIVFNTGMITAGGAVGNAVEYAINNAGTDDWSYEELGISLGEGAFTSKFTNKIGLGELSEPKGINTGVNWTADKMMELELSGGYNFVVN